MTIGERIRQIRKDNHLTLVQFAERIKIRFGSVSKLEKGENNPSDQTINLICREFHVNETWLRTGEGTMREDSPADKLDAILQEHGLPSCLRGLFLRYANLSPAAQREVEEQITAWALEIAEQTPHTPVADEEESVPEDGEEDVPLSEEEIEEKVAAYRALLKKGRAVRLALGHGTPPQTKASGDTFGSGMDGGGPMA